ncbi:putative HNH homing endonuclease [Aeromonas phage 85AhydR10PP]|nr:putative HNH homing endonuclease [Aeromonas phage 85AhydR10PP]
MTKPKKMPARTSVEATCLTTGNVAVFRSIRSCAEDGGFEYSSIRNCLHGRLKAHAGHSFRALSPLREKKQCGNIVKVAKLRNRGLSNAQIAMKLGISPKTVPVYASQAVSAGLTKTWHEVQEDMKDDIK